MGYTSEHNEVLRILKEHGAVLERTKKHKCYRLPDGRTWVTPSSTSNVHAWKNQLSDLKAALGLNGIRGAAGERRPRKHKPQRKATIVFSEISSVNAPDLRSQLAGLTLSGSSSQRTPSAESVDAERSPSKAEVVGSIPTSPTKQSLWQKVKRWWRQFAER